MEGVRVRVLIRAIGAFAIIALVQAPVSAAAEEVAVCGRLSAFSAPSASRPQGAIAINRGGTLVEYTVVGAGTVTPPNIAGLGTALNPVTVRFSGTLGSDGVVTSYSLTQVASCQGPASLPGTATSGSDIRWLLPASGVIAMAILIALGRVGTWSRTREFLSGCR